jgi:hypothetical protein
MVMWKVRGNKSEVTERLAVCVARRKILNELSQVVVKFQVGDVI